MINRKITHLCEALFHAPTRKLSFHHLAHAISAKAFENAHLFRDKVEIHYKTHNKTLLIIPVRPPRFYSHEFRQKFYFDVKGDIESHYAMGHGPGGAAANANKNAVILRHKPSGVTIRSSKFRSLPDNRRFALNKINVYLEYFLLGRYSRLGRVFDKQHQKHLHKMQKKEVLKMQRAENDRRQMTLFEYFTLNKFVNKNHQNVEEDFLNQTRNGAWQWILENGKESVFKWIIPIPEPSLNEYPHISDSEFQNLLNDEAGSRRLRLSIQSCLEVFGMYLCTKPGSEHSQRPAEYTLLANSQNKKYWKYLIESRRKMDEKLWNALLDRLEHFGGCVPEQYAVLKKDLRNTIQSL